MRAQQALLNILFDYLLGDVSMQPAMPTTHVRW